MGESKVISGFLMYRGLVSLTPALFKGQLYPNLISLILFSCVMPNKVCHHQFNTNRSPQFEVQWEEMTLFSVDTWIVIQLICRIAWLWCSSIMIQYCCSSANIEALADIAAPTRETQSWTETESVLHWEQGCWLQ